MYQTDTIHDKVYPKLEEESKQDFDDILQTNIFNVMLNRRSQRKFEERPVEDWKMDMIFAAADTAPTAGGFQGFEIYHVKDAQVKAKLVEAANKQPYVNSPAVPSVLYESFQSQIKLSSGYSSEILTSRRYISGSILSACRSCFRIEIYMDRNDRRRKSETGFAY